MKIAILFAACSFIANGQTFENGQNKIDQIVKALADFRPQMMGRKYGDLSFYDNPYGKPNDDFNETVSQIQTSLQGAIENLEVLKGESDADREQTDVQQVEIYRLDGEVRKITEMLNESYYLPSPYMDLLMELFEIYGVDFYEPYTQGLHEKFSPMENETPRPEQRYISPIGQLEKSIKDAALVAEGISYEVKTLYIELNAILIALKNVTSDSSKEQAAESPGTTEGTTAEQTSTREGTTTDETGTTEVFGNDTGTTAPTTESSVVRKKNVLQRQLVDLLLKRLQKSATRKGYDPPN